MDIWQSYVVSGKTETAVPDNGSGHGKSGSVKNEVSKCIQQRWSIFRAIILFD